MFCALHVALGYRWTSASHDDPPSFHSASSSTLSAFARRVPASRAHAQRAPSHLRADQTLRAKEIDVNTHTQKFVSVWASFMYDSNDVRPQKLPQKLRPPEQRRPHQRTQLAQGVTFHQLTGAYPSRFSHTRRSSAFCAGCGWCFAGMGARRPQMNEHHNKSF